MLCDISLSDFGAPTLKDFKYFKDSVFWNELLGKECKISMILSSYGSADAVRV